MIILLQLNDTVKKAGKYFFLFEFIKKKVIIQYPSVCNFIFQIYFPALKGWKIANWF